MMIPCAPGPGASEDFGPYFADFIEGRRGEILDAALAVFAENGYEGGTMREIAARIGVTEPALYRHYAGKEALFEDLVAAAGGHIAERATSRLRDIRPETIRESLAVIMESRRQLRGQDGTRPVIGVLMMAAPHHGALRDAFRQHILQPMLRQLEGVVPPIDAYFGISRTPQETTNSVRAFISLFVGSFMTSMMFGDVGEASDAATVDAMLTMMGWNASIQ